jgi:hypothetical protein
MSNNPADNRLERRVTGNVQPFSKAFLADALSVRRAINSLLKHRVQFAVVPMISDDNGFQFSTSDEGAKILFEEGIIE